MSNEAPDSEVTDDLLKAMLVFSRTVDHVLGERARETANLTLSRTKLQLLRLLGRRGAQSATRIAHFLDVSKPAVTQIVHPLLESGLVERHASTEDRRRVEIVLTPRGEEVLERLTAKQRHFIRTAARDLRTDAVRRCTDTLLGLVRALMEVEETVQSYCLQCGAHDDDTCVLTGGEARCLLPGTTAKNAPSRP